MASPTPQTFCTGCTAKGCLCRTSTTFVATAAVATIDVDRHGFCAIGAGDPVCIGTTIDAPRSYDSPRCSVRNTMLVCDGGATDAGKSWAAASRSDYVVVIYHRDTRVSINALRSIA